MEKIDWIIAAVGAAAILATVLGVVFYDELAGEQDVEFTQMEREVAAVTAQPVGSPFQFQAGDNATGAVLEVVIHHQGSARNPSGGNVRIEFTDPNGTVHQQTKPLACSACPSPAGTTLNDLSFTFDVDFFDLPGRTSTDDFASFNQTQSWMQNYVVRITVTPPTETPALGTSYSFTADLTLTERFYEAHIASPDVETI